MYLIELGYNKHNREMYSQGLPQAKHDYDDLDEDNNL